MYANSSAGARAPSDAFDAPVRIAEGDQRVKAKPAIRALRARRFDRRLVLGAKRRNPLRATVCAQRNSVSAGVLACWCPQSAGAGARRGDKLAGLEY